MPRPLTFADVRLWTPDNGAVPERAVRFHFSTRVLDAPAPGARVVDLAGFTLYPGLVNAHDHLELNHYPRTRPRERYTSAHDWGEDMNALLDRPPFAGLRAHALSDRLLIGGVKNLLCGATTVAHHNPPHRELFRPDYPVRVVRDYGWSHSLHFDDQQDIVRSYHETGADTPWVIHLAEGTDEGAAEEYGCLKALGAAGSNTVVVHGVGLREADVPEAARRLRGLVWCPSTNRFLLGQSADVRRWVDSGGRLVLGSDSRLTADGDLLSELKAARAMSDLDDSALLRLVTSDAAAMFGLPDAGTLRPGSPASFIALPSAENAAKALVDARRADLALVVVDGIPQIGDPELMRRIPGIRTARASLDGAPKLIHLDLARRLVQCNLAEPRLEIYADDVRGMAMPPLTRWLRRGRR